MKRRSSAHHSNAFGIAIFFGMLIFLLILAAGAIKIYLLFSQSTFDGKHQYVVALEEPHATRFVVYNPDNSSYASLLFTSYLPANPVVSLGIPIDVNIRAPEDIAPAALASALLFHTHTLHSSMTIIDAINLFIFATITHPSQTSSQEVTTASIPQGIGLKTFSDATVYKEAKSISVINGTGVAGLGGKIAALCTDIGANVIATITADTPSPTSSIGYTGDLSYTALRLSHLLHLPLLRLSHAGISDITITLGTDKAQDFSF